MVNNLTTGLMTTRLLFLYGLYPGGRLCSLAPGKYLYGSSLNLPGCSLSGSENVPFHFMPSLKKKTPRERLTCVTSVTGINFVR